MKKILLIGNEIWFDGYRVANVNLENVPQSVIDDFLDKIRRTKDRYCYKCDSYD